MFTIQGDTILDPFFGTGTTMIAAMCAARNSVGYEIDWNFGHVIDNVIDNVTDFSNNIIDNRLKNHIEFVESRELEKGELKHKSTYYGFNVMTKQEKDIFIPKIDKINRIDDSEFNVIYYDEAPNINDIYTTYLKKEKQGTLPV
jgi:hypothetical protein